MVPSGRILSVGEKTVYVLRLPFSYTIREADENQWGLKLHLPVVVDPSHGVGDRRFVADMARAAVAAGHRFLAPGRPAGHLPLRFGPGFFRGGAGDHLHALDHDLGLEKVSGGGMVVRRPDPERLGRLRHPIAAALPVRYGHLPDQRACNGFAEDPLALAHDPVHRCRRRSSAPILAFAIPRHEPTSVQGCHFADDHPFAKELAYALQRSLVL